MKLSSGLVVFLTLKDHKMKYFITAIIIAIVLTAALASRGETPTTVGRTVSRQVEWCRVQLIYGSIPKYHRGDSE